MFRNLAIAAALSTVALVGLAPPAAAQTYGGVTFSFGSGGYGGYSYDNDAYDQGSYYAYRAPLVAPDYYYAPNFAWRAHEHGNRLSVGSRSNSAAATGSMNAASISIGMMTMKTTAIEGALTPAIEKSRPAEPQSPGLLDR